MRVLEEIGEPVLDHIVRIGLRHSIEIVERLDEDGSGGSVFCDVKEITVMKYRQTDAKGRRTDYEVQGD